MGEDTASSSSFADFKLRGDACQIAVEKVKQSDKLTDLFIQILKERRVAEETYAGTLEKIATRFAQLQPDESTQHEALATMKINLLNKAEQARRLAESIDQDVRTMLAGMVRQHQPVLTKIEQDGEKMQKHLATTHSTFLRTQKRYDFASTQGELLALETRQEDAKMLLQPKEFMKLSLKAFNTAKEATLLEKEYQKAAKEAQEAQAQHEGHLPFMLDALQDMEQKKGSCFRDAVKKVLVYETSWLRNVQYDLDAMIKVSDAIDPDADSRRYVQRQLEKPDTNPLPPVEFVRFPALSETPMPTVRPQDLRDADSEILMDLRRATKAFFDGMEVQKLHTSNAAILRAWVPKVLDEELNLRGAVAPFGKLEIPTWCQSFIKLFLIALDAVESAMDIWAGLMLMRVAARLHVGTESFYAKVYHHPLWNRVPFWEEALFLTIQMAWQNHAIDRRDRSAWTLDGAPWIQCPYLVDNVEAFCIAMGRFGLRKKQVCDLVEKICKTRCDHLSPAESQEYRTLILTRVHDPEPMPPPVSQKSDTPTHDATNGDKTPEEEEPTPEARTDVFA